jgi:hypothetical protein
MLDKIASGNGFHPYQRVQVNIFRFGKNKFDQICNLPIMAGIYIGNSYLT